MNLEPVIKAFLGEPFCINAHKHTCKDGRLATTESRTAILVPHTSSWTMILKLCACLIPVIGLFMAIYFHFTGNRWFKNYTHKILRYVPSTRCLDGSCATAALIMSAATKVSILGGFGLLFFILPILIITIIVVAIAYGIKKLITVMNKNNYSSVSS